MKLRTKSAKYKRLLRKRPRRIGFEQLEDRRMLAIDCSMPESGATNSEVTTYVDCITSDVRRRSRELHKRPRGVPMSAA